MIDKDTVDQAMMRYYEHPGLFCRERLGTPELLPHQRPAFEAMLKDRFVLVASACDMGKTYAVAEAILEAFYVQGYVAGMDDGVPECYVLVTAPSWAQVKSIVFGEIRKKHGHAPAPLGGSLTSWELRMNRNDKWVVLGFSPRTSNESDMSNFQGLHAKMVRIVIEEGVGVDDAVWDMAEGMTTSGNVGIWSVANPTDNNSRFARMWRKDFRFKKFEWSCFLSPNLEANGIRDLQDVEREVARLAAARNDEARRAIMQSYKIARPEFLTTQWVVSMGYLWGLDSPLFRAKALAKFPDAAVNSLVGVAHVERAMSAESEDEGAVRRVTRADRAVAIGVDCARFGSDSSFIYVLDGNAEERCTGMSKFDTTYVAGAAKEEVARLRAAGRPVYMAVDVGGLGAGVVDPLRNDPELKYDSGFELHEVNFGQKAVDEEHYVNAVSEMARLVKVDIESKDGMIIGADEELAGQLTDRRYKFDKNTRFWLEDKESYKKRHSGRSPDKADAFKLARYAYHLHDRNVAAVGNWDEELVASGGKHAIKNKLEGDRW